MAIVEVRISPVGMGTSLSKYVAGCYKVLQEENELKHQLTPMGTIIEGDLDKILAVIRKMHEVPFHNGAGRVSTTIMIDDRRDREASMEAKVAAVQAKL